MNNITPVDILIIEDNPSDLELSLHALRKYNLTNNIEVVRDGAEALKTLFQNDARQYPKVILLDLNLPKISGLDVLRRIKSEPKTNSIPVVVMTSSREDKDLDKCYDLGVNSYVVKPVDFRQFTDAIQQVGLYWLLLNESLE